MPTAAPKPCRHAGCGKLVSDGSGFCAVHQADRKIGKFGDRHRESAADRGYGKEWQVTRKRILSRDKGLCQPCINEGRYRPARQVDHKIPKGEGGTDADDNLQAICEPCHKEKTQRESARGRGL